LETKVAQLEHKIVEPTDLVNPLLPLITELLASKGQDVHGSLLQALIPIIDQAIQQRGQQDEASMGAAIGEVLPAAIRHEISTAPTSVAKALAPEMALALQEQARLDSDAVAQALGPQMGEAIKTQILVEREAMVDALYPVIGTTISKYMVEVVKTINDKVETSLSPEGVWRKIRAKIQGVSEAELILRESLGYKIQSILLIHKTSGLVIRHLQPPGNFKVEAAMLAGMLTAMRSFVSECITQPDSDSELHEIEYDASKIILEIGGYCYLAVLVRGNPSPALIAGIRETLGQIILKAGKSISTYAGDPSTVPASVDVALDKLLQSEPQLPRHRKFPSGIHYLMAAVLIPLAIVSYRGWIARQVEARAAAKLDSMPELAIYRVTPRVEWGKLILTGRLPNSYLRQRAEAVVRPTAEGWPLRNEILTVEASAEPTQTAGEVERVIWIFNQKPGTAITASHPFGSGDVTVQGVTANLSEMQQLTQSLQKIPGIRSVTSMVQVRPVLETQIYFAPNVSQVDLAENRSRIDGIRQFLDQNPGVALKIIGYSDPTGEQNANQQLSLARARAVQAQLVNLGIQPQRLQAIGSKNPPPQVTTKHPLWLSRIVRFEIFVPNK
jgi:outer membrane protein OmpA-like peptidoglycan-associated protein